MYRGSYLLIINLSAEQYITVGRLGEIPFPSGWYAYIGSAMRGFRARLPHYLRNNPKPHWHIDYLLQVASISKILILESQIKKECLIARKLGRRFQHVPGFGCSDCKCKSHLYFAPTLENLESNITLADLLPMEDFPYNKAM